MHECEKFACYVVDTTACCYLAILDDVIMAFHNNVYTSYLSEIYPGCWTCWKVCHWQPVAHKYESMTSLLWEYTSSPLVCFHIHLIPPLHAWENVILFVPSSACHYTGLACPATQPTLTSDVVCQELLPPSQCTQWRLSYTCNVPSNLIIWRSSFATDDFSVAYVTTITMPSWTIQGVDFTENHSMDPTCLNSTLTMTGENVTRLNGTLLWCMDSSSADSVTILIPGEMLSPVVLQNC